MTTHPIVVLGGGYAGVLAAIRVARLARATKQPVILVSAEQVLVERIRLHQRAVQPRTITRPLVELVRGTNVQVRTAMVQQILASQKRVVFADGELAYEKLVVAVGSEGALPSGCSISCQQTPLFPTLAAVDALRQSLPTLTSIVILGGGLTAIEFAAELAECARHIQITLVARTLGRELSDRAIAHIRVVLTRLGVRIIEGETVTEIAERQVVTTTQKIACDRCIVATGVRAPALLAQSGLATNNFGQVLVDAMLRARGFSDVYVVGDAGALPVRGSMGCKSAMPMAAHAADNLVRSLRGAAELPFAYRDPGFCVSLGRRDGVIQRVDRTGAAIESITRGKLAAFIKEAVCRSTVIALRAERWGIAYRWSTPPPTTATLRLE